MIIFISKTSNTLNRFPYNIEIISPYICLNPIYKGVKLQNPCIVMMDSGAYQDKKKRVTLENGLKRQQQFEASLNYPAKYLVAYDTIDNLEETMLANKFFIDIKLPDYQQKVLVVQGNDTNEYSKCLKNLLEISIHNNFVLGFGGIAKAGVNKKIKLKLYQSIKDNHYSFSHIKHIHLFGTLKDEIITFFQTMFPNKIISCDTAGIEFRSVMGYVFENGKFNKIFAPDQKFKEYHPNFLAKENVKNVLAYYSYTERLSTTCKSI